MRLEDFLGAPNPLAHHYSRFRVAERLLLTGHSHQAWPDCGFAGQQQAWLDAAELVDNKWGRAEEQAEKVREGFRRLLGEPDADIGLGHNTLELVVRFISALPFAKRPRLVSTHGEFHSIRRLLDRLQEDNCVDVVRVDANPVDTLAERLRAQLNDVTAAVLCSSVLYQSARIVPGLTTLAESCARHGAELLIDAYHQMNVVPFDICRLENAYVVGGGYKYCQLGEGNSFLRLPKDCRLRPITTGWYSEFKALSEPPDARVVYGAGGHRFDGATYDPTSHYRAAAVFEFFERQNLTPEILREISQHQIRLLAEAFDSLDLDPRLIDRDRSVPMDGFGGFLVLWSERAGEICDALKLAGVRTDFRGNALRFGPAPYLSDSQLEEVVARLGGVLPKA
jgi:kynureninase